MVGYSFLLIIIVFENFQSLWVQSCLIFPFNDLDKDSIQRNIRGQFTDSERRVKDLIDLEGLEENDNEGIEVPYFDFESIVLATNDFSDANKLGKGGYGPVYKVTHFPSFLSFIWYMVSLNWECCFNNY